MKKLIFFLILMSLSSLFMGISINGVMGHIYDFEFIGFPRSELTSSTKHYFLIILWLIAVISHIFIFMLPILIKKPHFTKALIFAPLTYFVLMGIINPVYSLLLVPALIIWLICLWINKNLNTQKAHLI